MVQLTRKLGKERKISGEDEPDNLLSFNTDYSLFSKQKDVNSLFSFFWGYDTTPKSWLSKPVFAIIDSIQEFSSRLSEPVNTRLRKCRKVIIA